MCSSQHQPELPHRSQSNFILRISYPTHRDVGQRGSLFFCVRPTKKGPGSLTPALSYQHQGCSPLMVSGLTPDPVEGWQSRRPRRPAQRVRTN